MSESPAPALKPRMTDPEVERVRAALAGRTHLMEWGMGGSTALAFEAGLWTVFSIESDAAFAANLLRRPELRLQFQLGRLKVIHADIGPTGRWGSPVKPRKPALWPRYYAGVWDLMTHKPDIVLIDGRWRVMCAAETAARVTPDVTVLVHDFWKREHYQAILDLFDVEDRVDTLAVLRRKTSLPEGRLAEIRKEFAKDPR